MAEAFKVINRTTKNGIEMKDTRTGEFAQACLVMQLFMQAQADLIKEKFAIFPAGRRDELRRLGSAMWEEVAAMLAEAEAQQAALQEPAFAAFKAKLLQQVEA